MQHPLEHRILSDPLAQRFLPTRSRWFRSMKRPSAPDALAALCMHRFLDEAMEQALSSVRLKQVIVLDAGYDSRAWRFANTIAGRPVYEVDTPETLAHKDTCLRSISLPPNCRVAVPLNGGASLSAALHEAGAEPGERTLSMWELGAIFQSRASVKAILSALRAFSGQNSVLVMGGWYWPDTPINPSSTTFLNEPLRFMLHPEDVGAFLSRQGYQLQEVVLPNDLARRYISDDRVMSPSIYGIIARRQ
jgi:methyltransferase (TIGR00027 family)